MSTSKVMIVADPCEDIVGERKHDHIGWDSIRAIMSNVQAAGYDCDYFGGVESLVRAYERKNTYPPDYLFMNLTTGLTQESRKVQAPVLLELLDVRYTGSDPLSHALANNKHFSKLAVSDYTNCPTPRGVLVSEKRGYGQLADLKAEYVVIKPNCEGSSIGIDSNHPYNDRAEIEKQARSVVARFGEAVVEEYVEGIDATCLVLGNRGDFRFVHPLMYEVNGSFEQDHYVRGYSAKVVQSAVTKKIPLAMHDEHKALADRISRLTKEAFFAIGCRDIARVDYRIASDGSPVFLEINALPMLEPERQGWMALGEAGVSFADFIGTYISAADSRYS